jgi:hypothetical protein
MVKCNQVDESCYVVRSYMMVRCIVCDVIWCAWLVKRCVVNSEPAVLLQCNLGPGPQPLNSKKISLPTKSMHLLCHPIHLLT